MKFNLQDKNIHGSEEIIHDLELALVALMSVSMITTALFPEVGMMMCIGTTGLFFILYLVQGIVAMTHHSQLMYANVVHSTNHFISAAAIALVSVNLMFFSNNLIPRFIVITTLLLCLWMNYSFRKIHYDFPGNYLFIQSRLLVILLISILLTLLIKFPTY